MKNYVTEWAIDVQSRPSTRLKTSTEVTGVWDQHRGPRWEFAKIKLKIEPADSFTVNTGFLLKEADLEKHGYLNAAIMGLLDVLMTTEIIPLKNVHVTFIQVEDHPVDSSQMSFRQAGRDAARKLLEIVKANAFVVPSSRK